MGTGPISRRRLLGGIGAIAGGLGTQGRVAATPTPPPEAHQPTASKNWWYFNSHLYDPTALETPETPTEPLYDQMGTYDMEHGGDTAGHIQLFTFVENQREDGRRIGETTHGTIMPSTENYAAHYRSADATGHVVQTSDEDPTRWQVYMDPEAPVTVDLEYTSTYAPRLHRMYQEGGGFGNVVFWNQATVEGHVRTPDGEQPVVGVGFLEHVWGTWSRVPQRGVDYFNVHLDSSADDETQSGSLPTWASVYCRRTFYHGTPSDPGSDEPGSGDGDPVLEDVGPELEFTLDGETWYVDTDPTVMVTEEDGETKPIAEHRDGRPVAVDIEATLTGSGSSAQSGSLSLHLDAYPDATIYNPHQGESLGNVHEGAATVTGEVQLPGEQLTRTVSGIAQTEHQRYGPQYPY